MTDSCPHYGSDLRGDLIPNVDPERESTERYHREIGIIVRGLHDGVAYWMCPDCRGAWVALSPEYGRRYERASELVGLANMHAGVTT